MSFSSQYLNPASAAGNAGKAYGKEKAIRAAKDMQASLNEKIRTRGIRDPGFEFLELIGKGAFGRVFKTRHLESNKIVAVKIVDVDATDYHAKPSQMIQEDTIKDFVKEVSTLKTLKETGAKNVNLIYDAFVMDTGVCIVSEYCPGGSVHTLMKATPTLGLAEKYIIPIARELAEALYWVHSVGIIHRDVKAENVLVCEDGRVQLCDFGISAMLESNMNKRSTIMGTPWHMPPEMLASIANPMVQVSYGAEIDIWSFGCTLVQIATGRSPNITTPSEHLFFAVKENVPRLEGGDFSEALRDLVAMCLQDRPSDRPDIVGVQEHPALATSSRRYPTSLLMDLLEDYYFWEQQGGQRASLFLSSGAPVAAEVPYEEPESWNFSTTEVFGKSVENKRASALPPAVNVYSLGYPTEDLNTDSKNPRRGRQNSGQRPRPSALEPRNRPTPSENHPTAHPRIPKNPLERMFDKDDKYNYLDRSQRNFSPLGPPPSDLPLREHSNNSSHRETLIDLGDFDADSGTAKIPALATVRASRSNLQAFRDPDDEVSQPPKPYLTHHAESDGAKRATMEWTFPSLNQDNSKRLTKDWVFPGPLPPPQSSTQSSNQSSTQSSIQESQRPKIPTLAITTDEETDRRATMEWTFPKAAYAGSNGPSTARLADREQGSSGDARASRAGLQSIMETASAPVSPPRHSVIDLGEYVQRPSTADSSLGPLSPKVDPEQAFGVEVVADHADASSTASHRASRSEPSGHTAKPSQSSQSDRPGPSDLEYLRSRADSLDEDGDVDEESRRRRRDHNAKLNWKREFYNDWKDAALFNPVPVDIKQPDSGLWGEYDSAKVGPPKPTLPPSGEPTRARGANSGRTSRKGSLETGFVSFDMGPQAGPSVPRPSVSVNLDDWDVGKVREFINRVPAPPSAEALAEGASNAVMAQELERLLGDWHVGLDTLRFALSSLDTSAAAQRQRSPSSPFGK